ncbi:MAG TPA: bifunctional phosphoribosylaminoimidazolecarboxamide formyltransferase/IMP cyclohydrolase [Candidatus Gracilibacteria bacterium]
MKRALLSVSDKTGIVEFAKGLVALDFEIISTGGTYRALQEAGVGNLKEVSDFTGFPEGLDGRIKTLTPQVFGGVLALRNNQDHTKFCQDNNLAMIDLVVVNLYPFKATYDNPDKTFEDKVENIDIGGPSMIRAAAKNYEYCAPVVDPADYDLIVEQYKNEGDLNLDFRKRLAAKTFAMTAHYDLMIARFWEEEAPSYALRYGENPHQKAVVIPDPFTEGSNLVGARILNGKPLSYNNFNDANGALELAMSFAEPFVAIIKHATPCGAAIGSTLEEAFDKAYQTDPISSFGGIIACNRPVTKMVAEKITSFFNEIVLAPSIEPEALEVLKTKPNLRVLEIPNFAENTKDYMLRRVRGGTLVQDLDLKEVTKENLQYIAGGKPSEQQIQDLLVAWKMVKVVKSNAIVIVKDGTLIGKGGGQTSRIDAMKIALDQAGDKARGAALASDAFFPFDDGITVASQYGIGSVIQPGGAMRDEEVIKMANEKGITMVFTGIRAFLH